MNLDLDITLSMLTQILSTKLFLYFQDMISVHFQEKILILQIQKSY